MKDKTSSYILSLHTSPNSSSEDNKLISQLILNTSLIGEKLLIMEGFFSIYKLGKSVYNYPVIVFLYLLQQDKMPSYFNAFRALHILDLIKNQV